MNREIHGIRLTGSDAPDVVDRPLQIRPELVCLATYPDASYSASGQASQGGRAPDPFTGGSVTGHPLNRRLEDFRRGHASASVSGGSRDSGQRHGCRR